MKSYTLNEIDAMREYVKKLLLPNAYFTHTSYLHERIEVKEQIEQRLRTYMMAGISPDELKTKADKKNENDYKNYVENKQFQVKIGKLKWCNNTKIKFTFDTPYLTWEISNVNETPYYG